MRAKIQAKVGAAFDRQLADAVQAFTGSREVDGGYDPVTGTVTGGTVTYEGRGVFSRYSAGEIDGQHILASDVRLTALSNEVTVWPQAGDTVTASGVADLAWLDNQYWDGEMLGFTVQHVSQDPAGASMTVQLRRT